MINVSPNEELVSLLTPAKEDYFLHAAIVVLEKAIDLGVATVNGRGTVNWGLVTSKEHSAYYQISGQVCSTKLRREIQRLYCGA